MVLISTRVPKAVFILHHLQGELELQIIPAFSMVENSALAEASLSGSKQGALAKKRWARVGDYMVSEVVARCRGCEPVRVNQV